MVLSRGGSCVYGGNGRRGARLPVTPSPLWCTRRRVGSHSLSPKPTTPLTPTTPRPCRDSPFCSGRDRSDPRVGLRLTPVTPSSVRPPPLCPAPGGPRDFFLEDPVRVLRGGRGSTHGSLSPVGVSRTGNGFTTGTSPLPMPPTVGGTGLDSHGVCNLTRPSSIGGTLGDHDSTR